MQKGLQYFAKLEDTERFAIFCMDYKNCLWVIADHRLNTDSQKAVVLENGFAQLCTRQL